MVFHGIYGNVSDVWFASGRGIAVR
jgi:hypothetical protein